MSMAEYVNKEELKEILESSLSKQTDELVNLIHVFMDQVDTRFKAVETEIIELKDHTINCLIVLMVSFPELINMKQNLLQEIINSKNYLNGHEKYLKKRA